MSIRIAFALFRDDSWTGGLNYLINLFSVLSELPDQPVVPVLFIPPDAKPARWEPLRPFLQSDPIVVPGWASDFPSRLARLAVLSIIQRDVGALAAFRKAGVDLIFRNEGWDGLFCPLPILAWIPDFQHRYLSEITTRSERIKRNLKFSLYSRVATRVLVSSFDGKRDCEEFFPASLGKVSAVSFAVRLGGMPPIDETASVLRRYDLPERFFYFPGQLWRHKNHAVVVEALRLLQEAGRDVTVVSTGNLTDKRHPEYPRELLASVERSGLKDRFRFLGLVPYEHIVHLMRSSVAVVNPSLFEGWSTTVEEAKAMGARLILSDLRVHREQAQDQATFFDPLRAADLAERLAEAADLWQAGPSLDRERVAAEGYSVLRMQFGERFSLLARQVVKESGR